MKVAADAIYPYFIANTAMGMDLHFKTVDKSREMRYYTLWLEITNYGKIKLTKLVFRRGNKVDLKV